MAHDHAHHNTVVMDMPMDMSTGMDNSTMPDGMGGGMMMYLHFSTSEMGVLFQNWNVSGGSYAGFCIALIIACFLKEFLFAWRTFRLGRGEKSKGLLGGTGGKDSANNGAYTSVQRGGAAAITLTNRVLGTVFYTINLFFGYMIMLVLMTYNWGFIFSILVGSALGHFVFNWALAPSPSTQPEVEAECCEK